MHVYKLHAIYRIVTFNTDDRSVSRMFSIDLDMYTRNGPFILQDIIREKVLQKYTYIGSYNSEIYSGITRDRVLNGEFYAQKLQKLIYLYLLTFS